MKAILVLHPGPPESMKLGDVPNLSVAPHQIKIKVYASGVNRADLVQRKGNYPPPSGESEILGLEVSGSISEVGSQVTRLRRGDRVMALLAGGGYAEEVVVDARLAILLPEDFAYEEGAAICEVFLTAFLNIMKLGEFCDGQRVLIHAGASGVGTAGIQILKGRAKSIFVTVGSQEKADFCAALGATPILYKKEKFAETIEKRTPGGVDIILDPVGAAYLEENIKSLAVDGRLVLIGLMGGHTTPINLRMLMAKRIRIIGSMLRGLPLERKVRLVEEFAPMAQAQFGSGNWKPIIDTVFPVAEVAQAHERMEQNLNTGKIILKWR